MIRASASQSQLYSYVIIPRFSYLQFYVLLNSLPVNIIAFCFVILGSVSAKLSYHLRLDLFSTLFLLALRHISSVNRSANSCIAVWTAVQISHFIIL